MKVDLNRSTEGLITTDGLSPGIEKALQYVRERFQGAVSVQDVARHSAISYHHLCRKFKKETGRTVVDLINWLRIEKAKDLLETSPRANSRNRPAGWFYLDGAVSPYLQEA